MLETSAVVIAIILFLVINKFFRITYIGFGAIWKVFFVCLFISAGIVSGFLSLFHSQKEPTIKERLESVQIFIEDELAELKDIQKAVDTNMLSKSIGEICKEMEDRKNNIVLIYQFDVKTNYKIDLSDKKIATKVDQIDELYFTYMDEYDRFIKSLEGKEESEVNSSANNSVNTQEDGVNGILAQMHSNVTNVNKELEKQLDEYLKRTIRQDDLRSFLAEYESYFTEISSYRSQLNINMVELANYWTLLDSLDIYEDLVEQLEFYLNENEIERDLDTISTRAGLRLRRFLLDAEYIDHDLKEVILNEPEEEIALINERKNMITDETLGEVVEIYLDFLMKMTTLEVETFDIYGEEERAYIVELFNQVTQLVEKYEEVSGGIIGYGRKRLNAVYEDYYFLLDY